MQISPILHHQVVVEEMVAETMIIFLFLPVPLGAWSSLPLEQMPNSETGKALPSRVGPFFYFAIAATKRASRSPHTDREGYRTALESNPAERRINKAV